MVCNFTIVFWSCHQQVVNTTFEELFNIAIEASVWDLEGTFPYYKVFENLFALVRKTVPIVEMKYPKSKNPMLVASIWWRLQAVGAIMNEKNNHQDYIQGFHQRFHL